jgi:hypothetical protein
MKSQAERTVAQTQRDASGAAVTQLKQEIEMWQELGVLCLPLPLLLLFLVYKQRLKRCETRTLISRLRSAGGL